MKKNLNIAIVGGGLAGLTAAIHLKKAGFEVQIFEKEVYPKHKVCGEYLSNEILPYWNHLGIDPYRWGAVAVSDFQFTTGSGVPLFAKLPLGGFGISRYALDKKLAETAETIGCNFEFDTVEDIQLKYDFFKISTRSSKVYEADLVIGAFGKRSGLDISLSRKFIKTKSPWMGIKAHYRAEVPTNLVSLHNFKGGYCGISKVEDNRVNVCYLTHLDAFKSAGDLKGFQKQILEKNLHLKGFFKEAEPLFEKPLSISQVSFQSKELVENHILMCGDSGGLIHPLCGNGMAMAVTGAKILSECIIAYARNGETRENLESAYTQKWKSEFSQRLQTGRLLQHLLQKETATSVGLKIVQTAPFLLRQLIKLTHGKPIRI